RATDVDGRREPADRCAGASPLHPGWPDPDAGAARGADLCPDHRRLDRVDAAVPRRHDAVDRARGRARHVAFAEVGEDALRLALEGIAEAAPARIGEAERLARRQPETGGVEPDRALPDRERGAGTRVPAEETGRRDRAPHSERRPFQWLFPGRY